MKKIITFLNIIFLFFAVLPKRAYAISAEESEKIQLLLNESTAKSGVPGLSIAIVDGSDTHYFSTGYANKAEHVLVTENTLYELASVSKAFTATGILLLEEEGLLSMSDSINQYLPWFTLQHEGEPVEMEALSLNHFLYHTSGITNVSHFQDIPEGNREDMLLKTVETLKDAELDFEPGQQYSYGTINYDVLGLVIEIVTGKSYEQFMNDEVFLPLGLTNTYLYTEDAQATGQMAQGYRTSFFKTSPYNAPVYAGNKPAGYIISNSVDMARWMNIQMGRINEIPKSLQNAIAKSHTGNNTVVADEGFFYGGGWLINQDQSKILHDGMNPNFSTQVILYPKEGLGITLLANGLNSNNLNIVEGVKQILDGEPRPSYAISAVQFSDILLSTLTIIFTVFALLIFFYGKRRKNNKRYVKIRRSKILFGASLIVTLVLLLLLLGYPLLIGYTWKTLLVWQSYSIFTALFSLFLLSLSITWIVWQKVRTRS